MSRYRPPAAPKSNYLTAEGEARLRQELDFLWRDERPRVTQQVSDAAALGDRSENAEYIYGKKRLREIDRRVRYLRNRLEDATVEVGEKPGYISMDAPLGCALLGKQLDDEVHISSPAGRASYWIVSIRYNIPE